MKITAFLSLILAVFALVFAFQNNELVSVEFFNYAFEGSVALIIISFLLIGFIAGIFIMLPSNVSLKRQLKKLRKENKSVEKRLKEETTIEFEEYGNNINTNTKTDKNNIETEVDISK